jgi:hypothetical protein
MIVGGSTQVIWVQHARLPYIYSDLPEIGISAYVYVRYSVAGRVRRRRVLQICITFICIKHQLQCLRSPDQKITKRSCQFVGQTQNQQSSLINHFLIIFYNLPVPVYRGAICN